MNWTVNFGCLTSCILFVGTRREALWFLSLDWFCNLNRTEIYSFETLSQVMIQFASHTSFAIQANFVILMVFAWCSKFLTAYEILNLHNSLSYML